MTHPGIQRAYTLRVRFGGDPDELDAVVAGAATWLFQRVDPSGRHPLEVTVTDTEPRRCAGSVASQPRRRCGERVP